MIIFRVWRLKNEPARRKVGVNLVYPLLSLSCSLLWKLKKILEKTMPVRANRIGWPTLTYACVAHLAASGWEQKVSLAHSIHIPRGSIMHSTINKCYNRYSYFIFLFICVSLSMRRAVKQLLAVFYPPRESNQEIRCGWDCAKQPKDLQRLLGPAWLLGPRVCVAAALLHLEIFPKSSSMSFSFSRLFT